MRLTLVMVAAISAICTARDAKADACDTAAADAAKKIGASVGKRSAGGMIALIHPKGGEITYGCADRFTGAFLAIFAKPGATLDSFTSFVGETGEALTGQPQSKVASAVSACISAAQRDRSGSARGSLGGVSLDCGDGTNGTNPKVTFEFPR